MEPEVWFRIVHVGIHGQKPVSDADTPVYRDQTVEIALGPKGAFQNGNIGSLTRRVAADRVINAPSAKVRNRKPPKAPRTPQVIEHLRKAIEWKALLESGEVPNQAAIARQESVTRARVTQVMGLLRLAPEIQELVLSLPVMVHRTTITERSLRPISQLTDPDEQREAFATLLGSNGCRRLC